MSKRQEPFIVKPAPVPTIIEEESTRKVADIARDSRLLWAYLENQMKERVLGWHDAKSIYIDVVARKIDEINRSGRLKYITHDPFHEHKTLVKYYPKVQQLAPSNLSDLFIEADRELEMICNSNAVTAGEYTGRRNALIFILHWTQELMKF